MHLHRDRGLRTNPRPPLDSQPPPRGGAAVAFAADASRRARRRWELLVDAALDRVFDEPLDVPDAAAAHRALAERPMEAWGPSAVAAVDWALARVARSRVVAGVGRGVLGRSSARLAGRALLPLTVALELGLAARHGVHELQVLASYLVARHRAAGLPVEAELVRRVTTSLYLRPGVAPDLARPGTDLTAAVARRWARRAVPGFGRGEARQNGRRIRAVERLDLARLQHDWERLAGRGHDEPSRSGRRGPR